ncbi:hypothetical protein PG991_009100 [Apiospora marii]|uniref:Uncharacterized protein n=1 Tax=Apiospora marii TaxID=335849 RepID=A0ABR1RKR5_9PEZI
MENTDTNRVDYSSHPEWLWPAYKFDLDPDDQFATLHEQFNTWKMPLQNAHALHADLSDLAHAHTTKDNLFHDLERRRQLRSKEMLVAWEEIALALGMKESILESDDRWAKFTQLSQTRALDALIAFLYTFLPEHEKRLDDADVSKRTEAETGSRRAAADTPGERVNLANKDGDVDESKRHNPGHPRRWNTEGGQDVDDLASIPSTTSCFNGMEVDVDKDRTPVSPLPKYISTEGAAPRISYKSQQTYYNPPSVYRSRNQEQPPKGDHNTKSKI